MKCAMCGKEGARLRLITESIGKGDDLLVIEDVPMIHCPNCHESYFTAKTLHEIDALRRDRKTAVSRQVMVARLGAVEPT